MKPKIVQEFEKLVSEEIQLLTKQMELIEKSVILKQKTRDEWNLDSHLDNILDVEKNRTAMYQCRLDCSNLIKKKINIINAHIESEAD